MEKPKEVTVLVVGGGGRCHAIVDALSRSPQVGKIYCAPGNAGIASQAECVPLKDTQVEQLRDFAIEKAVDLTVVGPEVALAAGIVDLFNAAGLRIFGPAKAAAVIESSKDFAKRLRPSTISLLPHTGLSMNTPLPLNMFAEGRSLSC